MKKSQNMYTNWFWPSKFAQYAAEAGESRSKTVHLPEEKKRLQ
jgi:hypothetical protein